MKKVTLILSLFVTVMATFPFCLFDNCPGDKAVLEQASHQDHHSGDEDGCGSCSPFCACATCAISIDQFYPFFYTWESIDCPLIHSIFPLYESYFTSAFFNSFWQPPKLG